MDGDRLFLALLASVRPLTALALSRALGVPNKSEINGALYAMERAGRVKRNVFPGSGPPLWEPVRPPTCVANVERPADTLVEAKTHEPDVVVVGDPSKPPFSLQELRSQALKALLLHPDGLAPSAVAKALHVSKKEANAALYALEVLGFATRESVCPPLWKVREGLHLSQVCAL